MAPLLAVLPLFTVAPVGLEVEGTTAGTEVQALSKTTRLAELWAGTLAAATEKSMHLSAESTMPNTKERQLVMALQLVWQAAAVWMLAGLERGVWEPVAAGLEPHVWARMATGEAEPRARRLDAARTAVKACMVAVGGFWLGWELEGIGD